LIGAVALLAFAFIPETLFERILNFEISGPTEAGVDSLRNRINTDRVALMMGLDNPVLGVGIGNFVWVKQNFYHLGRGSNPHNSYLWAFTGGGIGVLVLYLLLFIVTYRMLRQLERSGPPELLWLVKGMKVSLLLFLVFSFFADFWLSDFLYFLVGTTVCITNLWQTQRRRLRWPPPLSKREDRSLRQTSSPLVGTNPQAPLR
jgi:O-antigen ligase